MNSCNIDQDVFLAIPWDIFALIAFVIKHIDTFQLKITVANIVAIAIKTMLSTNSLPEFLANLMFMWWDECIHKVSLVNSVPGYHIDLDNKCEIQRKATFQMIWKLLTSLNVNDFSHVVMTV